MKNKITLYRGVSSKNLSFESEYINLSSSQNFAREYGDIILVYELQKDNICEEDISERSRDVRDYDTLMGNNKLDGYRWKISDAGIYHYRVHISSIKLVQIIYTSHTLEESISALTRFNRKYLKLNQTEFSQQTGIPRVKISEYENAVREPSLEKISVLSSLLDIPQELSVAGGKVLLSK